MRYPATFRRTLPILLGFLSAVTALGTAILGLFRFADGAAAQVTIDSRIGQTLNLGTADLQQTIINVVQWALGLLALVGVVMIIYGGIVWMTSAGNEQRIEKAKRIIRDAIIGTVIVLLAWAIVIFFIRGITGATGPGGGGGSVTCGAVGVCSATACQHRCAASGSWVADGTCPFISPPCLTSDFRVIWRSPAANAVNVPLCRIIQARFSLDVDPLTVDPTTTFMVRVQAGPLVTGTTNVSGDIVSFRPDADLSINTTYEVEVTNGLKSTTGLTANPETWVFTTGAAGDNDPPSVVNVVPPLPPFNVDICRQTKVQTVFDEDMDVQTIYGDRTCSLALVCPPGPGCPCTDTVTQRTCTVLAGGQTCTILGTVRLRNNTSGSDLGLKNNFSFPDAKRFSAKQVLPPLDATTPHSVVESGKDDAAFYYAGVRDACGNVLDGDADGTATGGDGDFGTADDDYEWAFTTGIVEQCIPAVTNVAPGSGWYSDDPGGPQNDDTRVTIDGENFGILGNVIFNRNVYDIATCFDPADHRVNQDCPLSWTDTQIIARVPTDSYSSVPGGNPIVVDAGGDLAVSPTPFDVQSPRISVLDPNNGNTNDFITIAGLHLGAGPGTVWFRTPGNQLAGLQPPAICGLSWWTDTQIVIKIPDLTTIGVAFNTWLTVQVERADGEWSDAQPFKYVDGPPRPGICNGSLCGVTGGVPVQLVGQNFENGPPVPPSVNHSVAIGATSPQAYAGWNNTQIDLTTVNTLPNGTHTIKVHTPAGWSNAWAYTVPCGPAPGVYETTQCIPAGAQPSPFPQKSRADACRNTGIRLEYTTDMVDASITNAANYQFQKCNTSGAFDAAACTVVVPIAGVSLIPPLGIPPDDPSLSPGHEGVRINYAGVLDADTWYRVTVSNQVTADSGARMTNDYVWAFRTKVGDACPVTDIWLNGPAAGPPDYLTQPPDWEDYDASVGNAATCDVFNPWLYTYTWDLVYNTGAVTLSNLLNPWAQRANSAAPGSDRIRVTSEGRSANRRIIVDYCTTDLDCQDYDDDGSNGDPLDCDASLCDDTTKRCTPAFKNAAEFTPASGTKDNWVTVQGCWFGGGPGSVTFMAGPQNATFPDAALCGDTWQDDEIVAVVPAVGLNGPIRVTRSDGVAATTGANWAEDGIVRPGMCRLVPESGTYFSATTAWGHLFGDPRPAGSDLIFTPNTPAATVTQWIDTRVTGTVPTNAVTGNTAVNNGAQTSNPRLYTVVPAARPTVTATVPADASVDICPNAQIKVSFSMNMKRDSIVNPADATDHPNVKLELVDCATLAPIVEVPATVGVLGRDYYLKPDVVLGRNTCYAITTVGDPDPTDGTETGVMSAGSLAMSGDHRFWFRVADIDGVCAIDHVDLRVIGATTESLGRSPYTFLCSQDGCDPEDWDAAIPGNQRRLITLAFDRNGQFLWHTHALTKTNTPNDILDTFPPGLWDVREFVSVFGVIQDVGSGTEYLDVLVDGDDYRNPDGSLNPNTVPMRVTIHLDRCELPWPEQVPATPFTPYQDDLVGPPLGAPPATNFSTWYCRDGGVTLPAIDTIAEIAPPLAAGACGSDADCPGSYQCEAGGICKPNLMKQFLFTFDDKPNDVIGIQVRKNPEHLSPGAWYDRYVPSENQGSPQSMTLAGYPAVREGRSIYVAGVNLVDHPVDDIYSNIYLLSYASDTPDELCTTLAYNGSFEVDDGTDFDPNHPDENATAGDGKPDGWMSNGGISLTADFVEGSQSVSIISPGAQSYVVSDLVLTVGKRYVVTGYFKHTGTGTGGIGLQRAICTAGGPAAACTGPHTVSFVDNDLSQIVTGDSGGWVQVRYEFPFNNPNLFLRVGCFADITGGNAGDTTLCDNIRVVAEGEEQCATDISPAKEIYNRMTQKFALNLNETQIDGGVIGLERLQRDHLRLNDLKGIAAELVNYQTLHGSYPSLGAGTYLPQMSTSLWPSWSETLSSALGLGSMPSDPRQSENASQLRCADPFEPATCWNEESKIFQCPTDIGNPFAGGTFAYWNYAYQTTPDGGNPTKLLGRFEYNANWINPVTGASDQVRRTPLIQACGGYPGSSCQCYSTAIPLP